MPISNEALQTLPQDALDDLAFLAHDSAPGTVKSARCSLRRFHRWLEHKKYSLADVSPHQLEVSYPSWCARKLGLQPKTCETQRYIVRSYLLWLIREGKLPHRKPTDFYSISTQYAPLPECALEFIEQRRDVSKYAPRRYAQLFQIFHQWLSEREFLLAALKREQVKSFLNYLDKRGYEPKPLHVRHLHMRIYLDWLRDRDLIACDCRDLFGTKEQYRNFELPAEASEYLAELGTHLSPDTVMSYKTGIKGFYRHLRNEHITLSSLKREHCLGWLEWMFEKEYSASTRLQRAVTVKGYLVWLTERRLFRGNPGDLIRSDDFPRLDDFLPRPLPMEVDIEVQRRLRESNSVYHKGALLLRYTGIRLGDLERLSFSPIHKDQKNRSFLKVPPGKLKVERLVPIDERTISLIDEIRSQMIPLRKSLGVSPTDDRLFAGRKRKSGFHHVYRSFKSITKDLAARPGVGSIYPHRLRHTYATSLLNAGIHPAILMVLLGHTDLRMTFRYARMSINLVHTAYFMAHEKIENGIKFPTPIAAQVSDGGASEAFGALQNVALWLHQQNVSSHAKKKGTVTRLIKRIHRLKAEIAELKI